MLVSNYLIIRQKSHISKRKEWAGLARERFWLHRWVQPIFLPLPWTQAIYSTDCASDWKTTCYLNSVGGLVISSQMYIRLNQNDALSGWRQKKFLVRKVHSHKMTRIRGESAFGKEYWERKWKITINDKDSSADIFISFTFLSHCDNMAHLVKGWYTTCPDLQACCKTYLNRKCSFAPGSVF